MVRLNRIYTKTGDKGRTSLGDGTKVPKDDSRLEAYATVDEANSCIGILCSLEFSLEPDVKTILLRIMNDLFDVGADLCVPLGNPSLRITEAQVTYLEKKIDLYNTPLNPLQSFVLPTGTYQSAQLHVARTVVRRAERRTWTAIAEHGESINPVTAKYLNRLSDLLFVLARHVNRHVGDSLWIPAKNQSKED